MTSIESVNVTEQERVRIRKQSSRSKRGDFVVYWMQAAQRTRHNQALEFAIAEANRRDIPLLVLFCLIDDYPDASLRHFQFMIEGIRDVATHLAPRSIPFRAVRGEPVATVTHYSRNADLLVCDRGYLRHQISWRSDLLKKVDCQVIEVETESVVPIDIASDKEEYAARTLRPKIERVRDRYIIESDTVPLKNHGPIDVEDVSARPTFDPHQLDLSSLRAIETTPGPVEGEKGGENEAARRLKRFVEQRLTSYAKERNDPTTSVTSELSPYLHFGQISPIVIARAVIESTGNEDQNRHDFLEELIVRRELSFNFVAHNEDYDSWKCLPDWAKATLHEHRNDDRDFVYSADQLDCGETHDPYWNASMKEMRVTGRMQGYMRMYWGKKVLEWTEHPEEAYDILLYLNNRYFLDGRDPNSYASIAWIFGKHDRPWKKRPIFGTVRYMNAKGLERKFDIDEYVKAINRLPE